MKRSSIPMKYYMYKITNMINSKIYIGVHSVRILNIEDDTYMGSGIRIKAAIKKYGIENFNREILEIFENSEQAFAKEKEIVNQEFVYRNDTYNLAIGGKGGKLWDIIPWNRGKKNCFSDESRAKMSASMKGKMAGDKNPMYGKNVADIMTPEANAERLRKIGTANKGQTRTPEQCENYSKSASKRRWIVHISGKTSHLKENDERLLSGEWQLGQKWR